MGADVTHVELRNLQAILADLYRTNDRALEVAARAGLKTQDIDQLPRPSSTWLQILLEAKHQQAIGELIAVAREDYPRHHGLALAASGRLRDAPEAEKRPFEWQGTREEVQIGRNDFLPVAFLEVGARIASGIVRIARGDGGFGSGFLIRPDLVVTNHHVLSSIEDAKAARIHIGAQDSLDGVSYPGVSKEIDVTAGFFSDEVLDVALVKLGSPAEATPIALDRTAIMSKLDRVFIIQHPSGQPKQVAIGVNLVMYADDSKIQYLTDTMPGSSGSPIFNSAWRLVGMHRAGGWRSEGDAKEQRYRNEGVPIARIHECLTAQKVFALS